jgi:hypothetical protein
VLWLDASEGSTLVADAQGLSQWRDKSGKGNHVGQPEAGARPTLAPTLQNGMAPISFDGATQFLTGPAVLPEGQTTYTIVALWRPRRQGVQSVFEQAGTVVQSNGRAALLAVGDAYGFNGEHNDCHQLVPYESNLWRLTCMDVDSARAPTVRIFDNGIRRSGVTPAPAALRLGAGGITVGRKQAAPGEFLDGEVAAVLVFDGSWPTPSSSRSSAAWTVPGAWMSWAGSAARMAARWASTSMATPTAQAGRWRARPSALVRPAGRCPARWRSAASWARVW